MVRETCSPTFPFQLLAKTEYQVTVRLIDKADKSSNDGPKLSSLSVYFYHTISSFPVSLGGQAFRSRFASFQSCPVQVFNGHILGSEVIG